MRNVAIESRPSPGFAFNALPDEHFYSVLARHSRLGAYPSAEAALSRVGVPAGPLKSEDMFNGPARFAVPLLAQSLGRQVAPFAEQHTLWPIVRFSMSAEVADEWLEYWRHGDAPPQSTARPMNDRLLHHDRRWRYCPTCLSEDRARHGTGYWHVTHQLPGLTSCQKHDCLLVGSCPSCGVSILNLRSLQLPPLCQCHVPTAPPRHAHWDAWLCSRFEWLRDGKLETVETPLEEIREGFGLPARITGKHRELINRLLEEVESVVGVDLLGDIFEWYRTSGEEFRGRQKPNLVRTTLKGHGGTRVRHPLYYLILAYAAESGVGRRGAPTKPAPHRSPGRASPASPSRDG